MPNCIILRGLPGSGKSKLAKALYASGYGDIASADYFFGLSGEYLFDFKQLKEAHQWCFDVFTSGVNRGIPCIVDNTNTTKKEYQKYVDYAKQHGYNVTILTVETDLTDEELAKRNVHGVLVETIRKMRERMKNGW